MKLALNSQQDFIEKSSEQYESKILSKKRFEDFIMLDNKKTRCVTSSYGRSIQDQFA